MDSSPSAFRRPCFPEEDDGLASIAEFSGAGNQHRHPVFSRTAVAPRRSGSVRNLASLSSAAHCFSPRSGRIFDARFEGTNHPPYFLEACFLCKKPLGGNRDIFMYRGDIPFCSEDCRQEQIDMEEAREKSISLSASMKAMRRKNKDSSSAQENAPSSPEKSQKYPLRARAVAAV